MIKSAFLLLLSVAAMGQTPQPPQVISQFLGVNQNDPSVSIGNEAQDALNVESSLNGTALLKRYGYSRTASLAVSTSPATGVYSFIDPNGNKQQIVCQDHNCAKSTNNSAFSVFLSTAGGTCMPTRWQFASISGFIYAVNDCFDVPWRYDGTTRTPIPTAPLGSIIEATKDRLVISGVSANPSGAYYSQSGTPTNFTTGINSADPYVDSIGAQGDQVRALKYALGRLFLFKTASITSCILGDQYTSKCFPVSNTVGTSDPLAVIEVPGSMTAQGMTSGAILFRGSDTNFWQLDQNGLNPISKKIPNIIASQTSGSNQSNTQTSQADWNAGTQSPLGSWNTTTLSGSIFPSSFSFINVSSSDYASGTNSGTGTASPSYLMAIGIPRALDINYVASVAPDSAAQAWTKTVVGNGTAVVGGGMLTMSTVGGSPCPNGGNSLTYYYPLVPSTTASNLVVFYSSGASAVGAETIGFGNAAGTSLVTGISMANSANGGNFIVKGGVTPSTYTVVISSNSAYMWKNGVFQASGTFTNTIGSLLMQVSNKNDINGNCSGNENLATTFIAYSGIVAAPSISNILQTSTFTSSIYDSGFSTTVMGPFHSTATINGGSVVYQVRSSSSPNNDLWSAFSSVSDGAKDATTGRYHQYLVAIAPDVSLTSGTVITGISLQGAATGQFQTQCIQPGSGISAWGAISCAQTLTGAGSEVFYATSAATCATLPAGAPNSWQTSVTNNATLSISTNAAVYIGWRSLLGSATDQAQVDACTLYWTNGTPTPPSWGAYDPVKNAAYWTAAINNASTANRVLKYDLNLNEWYPFGLNATALYRDANSNALYFGDSSAGYWNKYGGVQSDNGAAINAYWISRDFGNATNPFVDNNYDRISLVTKNQVTGTMTVAYSMSNGDSGSYSVSLATTAATTYVHSNAALTQASPAEFMNINLGNNSTNGFEIDALQLDLSSWGWSEQNP